MEKVVVVSNCGNIYPLVNNFVPRKKTLGIFWPILTEPSIKGSSETVGVDISHPSEEKVKREISFFEGHNATELDMLFLFLFNVIFNQTLLMDLGKGTLS